MQMTSNGATRSGITLDVVYSEFKPSSLGAIRASDQSTFRRLPIEAENSNCFRALAITDPVLL